ncbi:MAG TPA: hypothetical protein VIM98_02025 [Dyella sp.]|uniref:hypothetical protein n=1 Tax=Dyella sp. TaxID=1869338 RepID=UPI002F923505
MTKRFGAKALVVGLALAAMVAAPLTASAHGWGGGYHGGYGYYHGGYRGYHGGYWSGGRWVAGAILTGVTAGIVADALRPAPVYYGYGPRVVYTQPTVVYSSPVVTRRVVETRTVYEEPTYTRYVRDDGGY